MNKPTHFFLELLLILLFLPACQSKVQLVATDPHITASPMTQPTVLPATAAITVTATAAMTVPASSPPTEIPSLTPLPTPLPTSTPTVTPLPALIESESAPYSLQEVVPLVGYVSGGDIYDFAADEQFVYLLSGQALLVLDFHAPASEWRTGYLLLTDFYQEVYIAGNLLYLWRSGEQNSVLLVDIANPMLPRPIQEYSGPNQLAARQGDGGVYLQNSMEMWWEMPASTDANGLPVHAPILLTQKPELPPDHDLPAAIAATFDEFTSATKVINLPSTTYAITSVVMGAQSLVAYDTTNPDHPVVLATHNMFGPMAQLVYQDGVLMGGGLGHAGGRLHRFNLSDPTQPTYLDSSPLSSNGFAISDHFLFVGNSPGILTYDISNAPMRLAGDYTAVTDSHKPWMGGRTQILLDPEQERLFAVFGYDMGDGDGFEIVDASNPAQLQTLAVYPPALPNHTFFGIDDIALGNEILFVARDENIQFFSVANPDEIEIVGNLSFPSQTSHQIETRQTAVYITDIDGEALTIHIADVSNPVEPIVLGSLASCAINPNSQSARKYQSDIVVSQNRLYWLTAGCGLQIFDITAPLAPVLLETMPVEGLAFAVGDGLIFLQGIGQGLLIINTAPTP